MGDPLAQNAYGIDVSHWQGATPSLAGMDFLFARATFGTMSDETYSTHIANARKAGLLTGAYHFGDNRTTAMAQAQAFLAKAGDVDFYVLDHEGGNRMTSDQAKAFVSLVKLSRGHCLVYASLSGFPSFGQTGNWVAFWGTEPPSIAWKFWQFGGSGVDHDVFSGSPTQLRDYAASLKGNAMKPVTDELPATMNVPLNAGLYGLDGTTKVGTLSVSLPGRLSPFGCGTQRAMYAFVDKVRQIVLVTPSAGSVKPIVDPSPFTQTQIDAAVKAATDAVVKVNSDQLAAARAAGVQDGIDAEKSNVRAVLGL